MQVEKMQSELDNARTAWGDGLIAISAAFDEGGIDATRPVADGDVLELGALRITCMVTPGHTRGSLCFHIQADGDAGSVFTGDTLFVGGCGRLFEGEAEDMWPAIEQRLAPLPPETRVYVGHEYTIKNLEFAVTVDKDSERRACSWISQNR